MTNLLSVERMPSLSFASDNIEGASPEVLEAMVSCATGQSHPYGADEHTAQMEQKLRNLFECDLSVFLVPTGSAANSLCLSVMAPPWGNIFCHPESHINNDECGAPEFFTNGAKLISVDGDSAKIDPKALSKVAQMKVGDVHATQPACVSITQATEVGSLYSLSEIQAISNVCKASSIGLHMDGSRFANALVSLGCTPAEMTWKVGVDALSFGATKNGVPCAEAIVLFDKSLAADMGFRRKRAGHLFSKMRFLSAQMNAYLTDDLWLRNAQQANAMAQRLIAGLSRHSNIDVMDEAQANIVFCRLPAALIQELLKEGFQFYHNRWEPGVVRLVTSFATTEQDIDHLLGSIDRILYTL